MLPPLQHAFIVIILYRLIMAASGGLAKVQRTASRKAQQLMTTHKHTRRWQPNRGTDKQAMTTPNSRAHTNTAMCVALVVGYSCNHMRAHEHQGIVNIRATATIPACWQTLSTVARANAPLVLSRTHRDAHF